LLRILVLGLFALLTLPIRILVALWGRLLVRKKTVVIWAVGHERRDFEPPQLARCLRALEDVAKDPRICGLVLDIRPLRLGWAQLYELRDAVSAVREQGKRVEAHLDSAGDRELLLASAADHVTMSPAAELHLSGISASMMFYGQVLDTAGVVVDLESAGAYKSFGEPYTRAYPTRENREATNHLLSDLHQRWVQTLADGRSLDPADIETLLEQTPISASVAVEVGLIDGTAYPDQNEASREEVLGENIHQTSLRSYGRWHRVWRRIPTVRRRPMCVAVVHMEGPVVERRAQMRRSGRLIASDDVIPVLEELADNDSIKAVVLTVNSPGGSALASDLIARSVAFLGERKPVIASMGNVAASGGYYISAKAREIFAHPATITGSIGVVGGKVVIGPALAKLGVHHSWLGPAPDPGMMSGTAPFDSGQRARFRASLRRVYDRFLQVVATGRGREVEDIEPFAQGRVWTGIQALDNGLVDTLGDESAAVKRAAHLAGAGEQRVKVIPIRFDPPKFGVVSSMLQSKSLNASDLLTSSVGAHGLMLQLLQGSAGVPLAFVPSVLDECSWDSWLEEGSP
jgi:protease-4